MCASLPQPTGILNLPKKITQGLFRKDLYFRLRVIIIKLPPLRDRLEDIKPLTAHYLERFSHELKIGNPGIREEPWIF